MSGADSEDVRSVRDWLARWQPCVRAADYEAARVLFDDDVISFGTHQDVVSGLDALEQGQWRNVWGRIDGFAWDFDAMHVGFSPDRLLAFLAATWTSVGYHEDGGGFHRPGRTTAILSRPDPGADWSCIHTHFSLYPGTPPRSFGPRIDGGQGAGDSGPAA